MVLGQALASVGDGVGEPGQSRIGQRALELLCCRHPQFVARIWLVAREARGVLFEKGPTLQAKGLEFFSISQDVTHCVTVQPPHVGEERARPGGRSTSSERLILRDEAGGITCLMDLREEIVDAATDDGPMAVLIKQPIAAGGWPKIVIFHDGPGVRSATHDFAAKLAAAGYIVAVPDLYNRHGRLIGFEPEQSAEPGVRERMWAMLTSLTDDGIQHDLDVTLDVMGAAPNERLGCIGFCLGARAVFRTLMRLPDRFVTGAMWHPSFLADDQPDSPHLTAAGLQGSLYIGIGDADKVQSIAMHQPFFDVVDAMDNVTRDVFPGADHGYTWPTAPSYDRHASDTSWNRTIAMFETALAP